MDQNDIERYLQMVGHELHQNGMTLEILLLGGAVMVIEVALKTLTPTFCQILLQLPKLRPLLQPVKAYLTAG